MKKWLLLILAGVLTFSLAACHNNDKQNLDITKLPLDEAYAYAVKQYQEHPESHRDLCELQTETQQIIEIDGKYYQSYIASNVDIRYIFICQQEFPNPSAAKWDWCTAGTANEYSLDLLGKADEDHVGDQSQSDVSAEIAEPFLSILKNRQSFYSANRQANIPLSSYGKNIQKFSMIDMDADNNQEVAVMFDDGNILILRKEGTSVFGFDFGLHAMYQINKDGSFLWNSDTGNTYGCSKLRFTGSKYETVELWRVENNESGSVMYYLNNNPVSKDDFESISVQSNRENINWNLWTDIP